MSLNYYCSTNTGAAMPKKTEINSIMTKNVFTVDYNDTLHESERIMHREKIRHLPVVHDNKYVGMITEGKLLEYNLRDLYDSDDNQTDTDDLRISDFRKVIITDLPLVFPEDSVNKAIELMIKDKVDVLPVVDWHKNLVGIVTSIDLLLFLNKKLKEDF